jgi:hypothetical protein
MSYATDPWPQVATTVPRVMVTLTVMEEASLPGSFFCQSLRPVSMSNTAT